MDDSDTNLSAVAAVAAFNGLPKYRSCAIDTIYAIGCSH
jgi:hypothetical protein